MSRVYEDIIASLHELSDEAQGKRTGIIMHARPSDVGGIKMGSYRSSYAKGDEVDARNKQVLWNHHKDDLQ